MAMLTSEDILFHVFAAAAVISALLVVFMSNPIYSALFLALTMSILSIFFFMLHAPFVAAAQLTVYAGAVMVLFIMVVMLFDLKREHEEVVKFSPVMIAKVTSAALLCGFLIGVGWLGVNATQSNAATVLAPKTEAKELDKTHGIPVAGPVNPDEDLTAAEENNFVDTKDQIKKEVVPEKAAIALPPEEFGSTASLSKKMFSKYVFAFEAVSLLLLVAIVGSVALAKSKGGTHHVSR
jgi:NADH-quinone oxidoreductase subunit J